MPKLILRSNYFKNEPAAHRSNYIKYLGTREGVEMNPDTLPRFFYEDQDMHGRKENFIEYISDRPGAVHVDGTPHGLFSDRGLVINLEQVMNEVANHKGTVWINVISLKREDAARLEYDSVEKWQMLLRSHVADISEAFKINPDDLQWYAAFHNEGHHPHVHMVVYSSGRDGYLSRSAINSLKSKLTNDIFKYELSNLYSEKTLSRQGVKDRACERLITSISKLENSVTDTREIDMMMHDLAKSLKGINGKKVYGYLHKNLKDKVDDIVRKLSDISEISDAYDKWMKYQMAIGAYYQDGEMNLPELVDNKEFRSIKNIVIQEAVKLSLIQSVEYSETFENIPAIPENVMVISNLFKHLEKCFSKSVGGGAQVKRLVDSIIMQKEKEKRVALGQKEDDHEVAENNKYISM